jgi:uncharacterized protein YecE (DUF72 family)
MEFGKVEEKLLGKVDLSLPKDHAQTKAVLAKSKAAKTKVYVGCAKWGRPDWVGKIYPKGTKAANFLDEYAKHFNSIEFNAIYYKLPTKEQIRTWRDKTPDHFKFCPKFTDVITHVRRLKNAEKEVSLFLDVVYELGDKLGPIFLMPHPQMGAKHEETILAFLKSLPKDVEVFTEFRHPEWYTQPYFDDMFSSLEKLKRGSVITDTAGRRDCVHMRLTTNEAFIRFVGNSLHESDYTRIDDWVKRIKLWMKEGLKSCYFFMHQHEELYSPELARYLIVELNKHCGLNLTVPTFVEKPGLF